uniref:RRM domain-containing protein n=1 Tax=Kwoniella dejecticola CBS 10117 TaxID=1296121 RepID=A0A1A6A3Q7_9TREE|nr:uncharacterized protein I303_05545 [Kwoniella dejecticola CBS 10117]OBR84686.1 hypothetical protein I303_05545 [Kwoniella dejecticola CBS 10117]
MSDHPLFPSYGKDSGNFHLKDHTNRISETNTSIAGGTGMQADIKNDKAQAGDDGWNEERNEDEGKEKLDWSEMSVNTPIQTSHAGVTENHLQHDQATGDEKTAPEDGGWTSGHATQVSPPSQPFSRGFGGRRYYPNAWHGRGRGRQYSFSSHSGGGDRQLPTSIEQSPGYSQSGGQRLNETGTSPNDRLRQAPTLARPHQNHSFSRAVQNTLKNPPVVSQAINPATNHISADNAHHAVPTYDEPISGTERNKAAGYRDANRLPVPNARQWGHPAAPEADGRYDNASEHTAASDTLHPQNPDNTVNQPDPTWSQVGSPTQAAREHNDNVIQWANRVDSIPPAIQHTPLTSPPHSAHGSRSVTEELSRPEQSPHEQAPPVTLEYSDEGEADHPTPALTANKPTSSVQEESEVVEATSVHPEDKFNKAPEVVSVAADGNELPSSPPSRQERVPTGPRANQNGVERTWGSNKSHWWKRSPHPMLSPTYAKQRILVELPFPIRIDTVKEIMSDHFSKYGTIHSVWHYEASGKFCEKAFVVFQDPAVISAVFADPDHKTCLSKSTTHPGGAPMDIEVKHTSPRYTTRTVFVRFTGPRFDAKRSPNPTLENEAQSHDVASSDGNRLEDFHRDPLPPKLIIDRVPRLSQNVLKVFWQVQIRPPDIPFDQLADEARMTTGKDRIPIGEVALWRNIPEREIVPRLCEYFAEICEINPPTRKGQGWLVTVAGVDQAKWLMIELQRVPGLFVRWADEGDGIHQDNENEDLYSNGGASMSPTSRMRNEMEDANAPYHSSATSFAAEGYSPTHPQLRRSIVHTYKGRSLVQNPSTGAFIDQSAVFVGRLNRNAEKPNTLLRRFERYGRITDIEFNPIASGNSYITARILYQDKASADRAIAHENGMVSFGSVLKVEARKVLAADVEAKEMYVDQVGRAISPSMVSQYTPPSPPVPHPSALPFAQADYMHPPPVPSSYSMMNPLQFGMWYHPYPGQPIPVAPNVPAPVPVNIPAQEAFAPGSFLGQREHAQGSMAHAPPHLQIPMLCATLGIGYLPPGACPYPPLPNGPYSHNGPVTTSPVSHVNRPEASIPAPEALDTAIPIETAIQPPERLTARNEMRPIRFENDNGMFKPIYDSDQMKEYCDKHNIDIPRINDPAPGRGAEQVSLLPISSGGHDPPSVAQVDSSTTNHRDDDQGISRPLYASINDPPRHARTEAKIVPIPIPFSPVHGHHPLSSSSVPGGSLPNEIGSERPFSSARTSFPPSAEVPLSTMMPQINDTGYQPHIYTRLRSATPLDPRDVPRSIHPLNPADANIATGQAWRSSAEYQHHYQEGQVGQPQREHGYRPPGNAGNTEHQDGRGNLAPSAAPLGNSYSIGGW